MQVATMSMLAPGTEARDCKAAVMQPWHSQQLQQQQQLQHTLPPKPTLATPPPPPPAAAAAVMAPDTPSPSAQVLTSQSESSTTKTTSQQQQQQQQQHWTEQILDAPVYHPTHEQFKDPILYIQSIQAEAAKYGICRIVPPCKPTTSADKVIHRSAGGKGRFRFSVRCQQMGQQQQQRHGVTDSMTFPSANFLQSHKKYSLTEFKRLADLYHKECFGSLALSNVTAQDIEVEYWKRQAAAPGDDWVYYGNDVEGSGFEYDRQNNTCYNSVSDGKCNSYVDKSNSDKEPVEEDLARTMWNLWVLPRLPGSLLCHLSDDIPGVTSPMLYIGQLFASFAWHIEDNYMYSINYNHMGAAKTWYGVPASDADGFEAAVMAAAAAAGPAAAAGDDDNDGSSNSSSHKDKCISSIMNKTTIFCPEVLMQHGVKVFRAVQQPGEFVITFPRAYHSGFSNGYNIGEAANFVTADWWPYGLDSSARYRRISKPPMLLYEQLLLVEVDRLLQHAIDSSSSSSSSRSSSDLVTLKSFLSQMRWQHMARTYLVRLLVAAAAGFSVQLLPASSSSSSSNAGSSTTCCVCSDVPALVLLLLPPGAAGIASNSTAAAADASPRHNAAAAEVQTTPVCLACALTAAATAAGDSSGCGLVSWQDCKILLSAELDKYENLARSLEVLLLSSGLSGYHSSLSPDGLTESRNFGHEPLRNHPATTDVTQQFVWQPDALGMKAGTVVSQKDILNAAAAAATAAAAAAGGGCGGCFQADIKDVLAAAAALPLNARV